MSARQMTLESIQRLMHQAASAYACGEGDHAERLCRQILATRGEYSEALRLLGRITMHSRRPDEALSLLKRAVDAEPSDATAHYEYGDLLRELRRFQDALSRYEHALHLRPDFAEAHHNRGVTLQKLGRFQEALHAFDSALRFRPEFAEAYAYRGFTLQKLKRLEDSVESYDRALQLRPSFPEVHNNRGNALRALNRFEEALESYNHALRLRSDFAEAYNNRGVTLHELKRFEEALQNYELALSFRPDHADAYNNRGATLLELKRFDAALGSFRTALDFDRGCSRAHKQLGGLLGRLGLIDQATAAYRMWLQIEPTNPLARHMYAAASGENVPERCDPRCVAALFDDFARSFETTLGTLGYAVPQMLCAALAQRVEIGQGNRDVLDAGCGTGLCGPLLRASARTLVGVDLSSEMLARASARNVYDKLIQIELSEYMESSPESFDIVNCADTLIYFGALESVIMAARCCLRPGGIFAFSTEALPDGLSAPFKLTMTGRYAHSGSYLKEVMASAGFADTNCRPIHVRKEAGVQVPGYLCVGSVNG